MAGQDKGNTELINIIIMTTVKSLQKTARFSGILFLFNLLIPTFGYVLVQSKLFVPDNPVLTSAQILANEKLFRLGLLSEFILSIGLILLGYSLYVILRNVNAFFSKIALLLKTTEATIMAAVSLLAFLALQILTGNYQSLVDNKSLAGIIFIQHGSLNSIPMIFLGIEMVIFNVLFYVSGMIPRWISTIGIIAFSLIFIFSVLSVIEPKLASMLLAVPSFIYELIVGLWLIIKGIKLS
jgi:hypothetical protein